MLFRKGDDIVVSPCMSPFQQVFIMYDLRLRILIDGDTSNLINP